MKTAYRFVLKEVQQFLPSALDKGGVFQSEMLDFGLGFEAAFAFQLHTYEKAFPFFLAVGDEKMTVSTADFYFDLPAAGNDGVNLSNVFR